MAILTPCDVDNQNIEALGCVISNVITTLFMLTAFLAALFGLKSGIKLATSQGDPKALASAKSQLTWTILGFILAIGAIAVVRLVASFVGYSNILDVKIDTDLLKIN